MTTNNTAALEALDKLIAARNKCTKGNTETAEIKDCACYDCPMCDGQGTVEGNQFINFDDKPLNVMFSGIGDEFMHWQAFFDIVASTDFTALRTALTQAAQVQDELTLAYMVGKASNVPDGYVLVPIEPTEDVLKEMGLAFYADKNAVFAGRMPSVYQAMIAASQQGLKVSNSTPLEKGGE